jgi:hypothetical protein
MLKVTEGSIEFLYFYRPEERMLFGTLIFLRVLFIYGIPLVEKKDKKVLPLGIKFVNYSGRIFNHEILAGNSLMRKQ